MLKLKADYLRLEQRLEKSDRAKHNATKRATYWESQACVARDERDRLQRQLQTTQCSDAGGRYLTVHAGLEAGFRRSAAKNCGSGSFTSVVGLDRHRTTVDAWVQKAAACLIAESRDFQSQGYSILKESPAEAIPKHPLARFGTRFGRPGPRRPRSNANARHGCSLVS